MKKTKTRHIEFIYVIHKGDYSFLRINKVIKRYKYKLDIMPLDEFERMYRELFNLSTYTNQLQDYPVTMYNKTGEASTIYVSSDFYKKVLYPYDNRNSFYKNGYVIYLKTSKTIFLERGADKVDMEVVLQFADNLKKTAEKIEYCLRLIRYGFFEFDTCFAYIRQEQKVMPLRIQQETQTLNQESIAYFEKDNYLLAILLKAESNVSEYINVALQSFDQSFRINNSKIRFIQLILCLEICLNNFFYEPTSHIIARHTSVLLSNNKEEIKKIYDEIIEFYNIKKHILNGCEYYYKNDFGPHDFLRLKIIELENISRDILKKLIRMNIKDKEQLMYELNLKALQIRN